MIVACVKRNAAKAVQVHRKVGNLWVSQAKEQGVCGRKANDGEKRCKVAAQVYTRHFANPLAQASNRECHCRVRKQRVQVIQRFRFKKPAGQGIVYVPVVHHELG